METPRHDESQGDAPHPRGGVHVLARCVFLNKDTAPEEDAEGRLAMFRHTLLVWGTTPKRTTTTPHYSDQAAVPDSVTLMWRADDVREPVEIEGHSDCLVREGDDVEGKEDLINTLLSEDPRPVRFHGTLRNAGDPSALEIELANGAVFRTGSDILQGGKCLGNTIANGKPESKRSETHASYDAAALSRSDSAHAFPTTADEDARIIASPEAFAITALMCDYPDKRNMRPDINAMLVEHKRANSVARTYLDLAEVIPIDVDATEQGTVARLMQGVSQYRASRDEALAVLYVIARLLGSPDGKADVGFTELLDVEGSTRLGREDRAARALDLHNAFLAANAWKINVRRPWKSGGKAIMIEHDAPMFHYEGPAYREGQKPLPGMGWSTPQGFVFRDSTVSAQLRSEPKQASPFGPLLHIARIPRGQAWGDWAVSIGMALGIFVGRVNAQNVGATVRHSRRLLLNTFPPHHNVEAILSSSNPQRAREYWAKAMNTLIEQGVVGSYEEPPRRSGKGWKETWLDEMVVVRLSGEWERVAERVHSASEANLERFRGRGGDRKRRHLPVT